MNLGTAATELADAITAETDVPTTADPERLVIPGAWLVVDTVDGNRLDGATVEAVFRLYLIVGDLPAPAALDALGLLYGRVKQYASAGPAEFVQLALPNYASNGLPSLSIRIPTEITEE